MKKHIYQVGLGILCSIFTNFLFAQVVPRFNLSDFTEETVSAGIDSIWMDVVSWDGDTSVHTKVQRDYYKDTLLQFFHKNHKDPLMMKYAEKALLYSTFISMRNQDMEQPIQLFEKYKSSLSEEYWFFLFEGARMSLMKKKDDSLYINTMKRWGREEEKPINRVKLWYRLGQKFVVYDKDKEGAKQYFYACAKEEKNLGEIELPKELLYAKSYIRQMDSLQVGHEVTPTCMQAKNNQAICIADKNQKVSLLIFTAAWCSPCREELPILKQMHQDFGHRTDFQMISISHDFNEEKMTAYTSKSGIDWPYVFEGKDKLGNLTVRFNALSLPTYYIIDKAGVIRYNADSRDAGLELRKVLEEVLDKK